MSNQDESGSSLVVLGTEDDKPLVTITPIQTIPAKATKVDPSATGISRLAPLLQAVPGAAVFGEAASSKIMQVVIDGPLTAAADGQGYRAFTMGAKGIKAHARLFEPERLQNLVTSAAMFQIASAVVAQKHLADISAKLTELKLGVDNIAEFLESQRKSQITGALKYLGQVAGMLHAGEQDEAVRIELESIERELGSIHDHLNDEFSRLITYVTELSAPGLFGTSADLTQQLKHAQEKADRIVEEWKLCMSARWVSCGLLAQLGGRGKLISSREESIRKEIEQFLAADGHLAMFVITLNERIRNISALRDSRTTLQVNRVALRKWVEVRLPIIQQRARAELADVSQLLLEREKTVTLTIEMLNGECVAAYQE